MTIHTYIYTVVACTLNSRLLSGNLGVIAVGDFPVGYGSVDVQLTRLRRLNQGTLTSECAKKKSERNCLTSYLYSRVFFLFLYSGHKSEGVNVSIQYSSSSTNILYLNILYTNSGWGKRGAHSNNWSMVMQRRHPLLELP